MRSPPKSFVVAALTLAAAGGVADARAHAGGVPVQNLGPISKKNCVVMFAMANDSGDDYGHGANNDIDGGTNGTKITVVK